MSEKLKIGELAARTNCQIETIRYYEREGLLPPPVRSEGNYRLYDEHHVGRLSFIRHCRTLDMTLNEVRTLLAFCDAPERHCGGVNQLLDEHIRIVQKRIADMKSLEQHLKSLRSLCDTVQPSKHCKILNELASETVEAPAQKKTRKTARVRAPGDRV